MTVKFDKITISEIDRHVRALHRCMFFVIGNDPVKKVPLLAHLVRRCVENDNIMKILWFKKKITNQKRKLEKAWLKKIQRCTKLDNFKDADLLEMFLVSSDITYCTPGNSNKVLGQTYDACIFENFESVTPNLLARCIETVKGGGIIIFLEPLETLEQLYAIPMDVHEKYKTDWFPDVQPRFNKRFVLSLKSCDSAFAVSDNFRVTSFCKDKGDNQSCLDDGKLRCIKLKAKITEKMSGNKKIMPFSHLVNMCATVDQIAVVFEFVKLLANCDNKKVVFSLTSGRGRGKSASVGLGLAAAILSGTSNICVTAPCLENAQTLMNFACLGLSSAGYKENLDYLVTRSSDNEELYLKIEVIKNHKQIIEFHPPDRIDLLVRADLLCIDEAAAIPLNVVKRLLKAKFCVIASTIQGYEGTGRSLSLKLLSDLRRKCLLVPCDKITSKNAENFIKGLMETNENVFPKEKEILVELTLSDCIRYSNHDPVESWLDRLFCLSSFEDLPITESPPLEKCQLYHVNLDALFSGGILAEKMLSSIVAVYVASHYKNSPNDLLMLADAPAHKLFCLLGYNHSENNNEIICVIQVAMEGNISEKSLNKFDCGGERSSGNLLAWLIDQQFPGNNFAARKGVRVVRIATHTHYQKMGYGKKAMELLEKYYSKEFNETNKPIENEASAEVIIQSLCDVPVEGIDYIGVSFGASWSLIRFWKSLQMFPVYISQVANELTGEHTCAALKTLNVDNNNNFLNDCKMWKDFRLRFLRLLPNSFRFMNTHCALEILDGPRKKRKRSEENNNFVASELDLARIRNYLSDKLEMRAVKDLLHQTSSHFFQTGELSLFGSEKLVVMLGAGLQGKSVDDIAFEFNEGNSKVQDRIYDASLVMGILNKAFKSLLNAFFKDQTEGEQQREMPKKKMAKLS